MSKEGKEFDPEDFFLTSTFDIRYSIFDIPSFFFIAPERQLFPCRSVMPFLCMFD